MTHVLADVAYEVVRASPVAKPHGLLAYLVPAEGMILSVLFMAAGIVSLEQTRLKWPLWGIVAAWSVFCYYHPA